jgi:hypothetical protein
MSTIPTLAQILAQVGQGGFQPFTPTAGPELAEQMATPIDTSPYILKSMMRRQPRRPRPLGTPRSNAKRVTTVGAPLPGTPGAQLLENMGSNVPTGNIVMKGGMPFGPRRRPRPPLQQQPVIDYFRDH